MPWLCTSAKLKLSLYLYWQSVRLAHYGPVPLPLFIWVWITAAALSAWSSADHLPSSLLFILGDITQVFQSRMRNVEVLPGPASAAPPSRGCLEQPPQGEVQLLITLALSGIWSSHLWGWARPLRVLCALYGTRNALPFLALWYILNSHNHDWQPSREQTKNCC